MLPNLFLPLPLFLPLHFSCHPSPKAEDLLFAVAVVLAFVVVSFAVILTLSLPKGKNPRIFFGEAQPELRHHSNFSH